MKRPRIAALICLVLACLSPVDVAARDRPSPVSQGRWVVSAGGGLGSGFVAVGGGVGYFVLDGLLPGVKYLFSYRRNDVLDYRVQQHDLNAYLRYYFVDLGRVFPFVVGDGGWLRYRQYGEGVEDLTLTLYSLMGGAGAVFFLSDHFSLELLAGVRHYLDVPPGIRDDFDETRIEWGLGFGLYL